MSSPTLPLRKLSRPLFALAFKLWCKTPRWLALRRWYLPFYGAVGYSLDDRAFGVFHLPPHPAGRCEGCDNARQKGHINDDEW